MGALQDIHAALAQAAVRPLRLTLVRCVALIPLTAAGSPDYLFTSGKPGRFNPAGVACVYFSEDEKPLERNMADGSAPRDCNPSGHFLQRLG